MANYNSIHTGSAIDEAVTKTNKAFLNPDQYTVGNAYTFYPGDSVTEGFDPYGQLPEGGEPSLPGEYILKLFVVGDSDDNFAYVYRWVENTNQ